MEAPPDPSSVYFTFPLMDGETWDSGPMAPGPYSVMENVPAGWELTDISCVDPSGGTVVSGDTATIDLAAGETVTCTFTNAQAGGSITIVKDAIPFGTSQDFSFSGDLGAFDLDDDSDLALPDSMTFSSLMPGTYSVTEASVEGWLLTGLICSDPTENSSTDTGTATATIILDGAETVTCTFENAQLGKLIIDKETLPVGDPTSFDFDLEVVEGPIVDTFSLADQDPPYMTWLLPNFYSVSESEPMDWTLLSSDCDNEDFAGDIQLFAGDTVTCTFVNETTVDTEDVVFSKAFAPNPIGPGSSTTLTFTIINTSPDTPASLLTFEDVLPGGLSIAAVPGAVTDCGTPILSAPAGGDTISMSFGGVGAGETCTVTVNVTSSIPGEGPFTNTSGNLTSSAGNSGPATADLTVDDARPGFSKSFSPSSIPLGATSTLTFEIDNSANSGAVSDLSFADEPSLTDMVVATPANASTDCGPGAVFGVSWDRQSCPSLARQRVRHYRPARSASTSPRPPTASFDNVSGDLLHTGPASSRPDSPLPRSRCLSSPSTRCFSTTPCRRARPSRSGSPSSTRVAPTPPPA